MRGDTLVFEVTSVRPSPVAEKVLSLALRLEIRQTAEFIAAAQAIPRERLECLTNPTWTSQQCQIDAVAIPALAPFLRDALSGRGVDVAAKAIQKLGDRNALPALRQALQAQDPDRAAVVAEVLWSLGDSTGLTWVRDHLRTSPTASAMSAAARMRDMASVPLLIEMLGSRDLMQNASAALAQYESRQVWLQAADGVLADSSRALYFLLSIHAYRAVPGNPELDQKAHRVAIIALRNPDPFVQSVAARHLVRFSRDTTGITQLIRLLTEDRMGGANNLEELVEATAVDSVPVPFGADETELARARAFWTAWWERSRVTFRFPDDTAGRAAVRRWRDRWPDRE